ncbi:MAG TPA: methylated-DNA--[protein]-cysteine S-methyltransferase [Gaiellales bacterium]|nr:methylated-DNA--[protein]-cysteine S-methyltransferase [Gaiellales bacterium]
MNARLVERAAREGLADVVYATCDAPFGQLTVAATERGLVRVAFASEPPDAVLRELAERVSPRVLEAPARLDAVRRELDEYFGGHRRGFDLKLDWTLSSGFLRRAREAALGIPYGEVRTYAELAAAAGSPRAVRAAGNAMARNPLPIVVPCHRVLRTGGGLGGYGGGLELKRRLLDLERGGALW